MSAAARRAAGIPEDAPRYDPKKQSLEEILRTGKWANASNLGSLKFKLRDLDVPDAVHQWLQSVHDGTCEKGLLLSGNPGAGKTTLAKAIGQELLEFAPRKALGWTKELIPNRPVYFYPYVEYINDLQRRMHLETRHQFDEEFDELDLRVTSANLESRKPAWMVRWLILDDIGKEYSSGGGWSEAQLDKVLRARGHQGLLTIATTNLLRATWGKKYGAATESYAHEHFVEVVVAGKDWRK